MLFFGKKKAVFGRGYLMEHEPQTVSDVSNR